MRLIKVTSPQSAGADVALTAFSAGMEKIFLYFS